MWQWNEYKKKRKTVRYTGGIGRFLTVQGLCGIVGISIGGKNSSLKWPHSSSFQAKPSWCSCINRCISFHSSGHRNPSGWAFSIICMRSFVYRPISSKGAGWVGKTGISLSGSPLICQMMRYRSGSLVTIGRTFLILAYILLPSISGNRCVIGWVYEACHNGSNCMRAWLIKI